MTASVDQVREWIIGLLPRLRRFARTITRNHDDADDLVQIAVERALQRYEQWRPDSRFESWMFGIVRNAWIDEVRARQRRNRVLAPEAEGEHVGGGAGESQAEALSIHAAMAALPEEQRMAVALVLIEGLSYKEAAEALVIPIGTLTSRLARGREALQALL
jgi:RNA polymerase sigma-70 factor (ECF subfamily)